MVVSSAHSDYSPHVTLIANVRVSDSVRVAVSRATLLAPGEVFPGMGAIAANLTMQVLLVSSADTGELGMANARTRNGNRKVWTERTVSQILPIADSLYMGIPRAVGALRFSLPLATGIDAKHSWLVFRIAGPTVSSAIHMADGTVYPARVDASGVRVFACSTENLNGATDKLRAKALGASYNEWC